PARERRELGDRTAVRRYVLDGRELAEIDRVVADGNADWERTGPCVDEVRGFGAAGQGGAANVLFSIGPVQVNAVGREPVWDRAAGAGAVRRAWDEHRISAGAVEVRAPDRVGLRVGPVDVAAVDNDRRWGLEARNVSVHD